MYNKVKFAADLCQYPYQTAGNILPLPTQNHKLLEMKEEKKTSVKLVTSAVIMRSVTETDVFLNICASS